ncbi:hypothetical protein M0R45_026408 [Rubus argutus]|uniref:Aminotransferase class V domain-containing protein n=1 Tax=Rubus argutus TaxID=59490 RepID=A0AAW1WZ51_RUBAR
MRMELNEANNRKTKLVVVHHVSNVLGSVLPIEDVTHCAHDVGAKVLIDACQSVPHMVVDVQNLNADFLVLPLTRCVGLRELDSFTARVTYYLPCLHF